MADIKEFAGLRPPANIVSKVAELPYDVIDEDEARGVSAEKRTSFFRISRPEVDLPIGSDVYSDAVYQMGKKNLESFKADGILNHDKKPMLYLYSLVMDGRTQTGLVCVLNIDDYVKGIIKKHELTREDKERDRIRHLDALSANTGLVFLFYKNDTGQKLFSDVFTEKPAYDFITDDSIRHIFHLIEDEQKISYYKKFFKNRTIYIADGHHRAASAVNVGLERRKNNPKHNGTEEYNYFLGVVFPHDELKIFPYNRIVKDLNGNSVEEFLKKISEKFSVEKSGKKSPSSIREFSMYLDGSWYTVKPRFDISKDPVESLDVKILQDHLLDPILGIKDPRKDARISFVGGIKGTDELERSLDCGGYAVAFSMYATAIEQLIDVSDADGLMPPKSTWFEPKLRCGIVLHEI